MHMQFEPGHLPVKKVKVNWAREWVMGALISSAFTIMASHAGVSGVTEDSLAAHIHDFIILSGVLMTFICGFAAAGVVVYEILTDNNKGAVKGAAPVKQRTVLGNLQAVKLLKIFLP